VTDAPDATLRRDLARLLAALFLAPPTAPMLSALQGSDARAALTALLGEAAGAALDAVAAVDFTPALREEFFAVLAVPGPRYKAPFESVHCDVRQLEDGVVGGLLLGDSAARVAERYARAGYAIDAPELPDHLGCELAFLAELLARAVDADDVASARRAALDASDFAASHPGRWLGAYAARLAADRDARLYPALALLADALVRDVARGGRARLPVVAT
jgi:TorA maturation chaperone TorD